MSENVEKTGCQFTFILCVIASCNLLYSPIANINIARGFDKVEHFYQYPLMAFALVVQTGLFACVIGLFSLIPSAFIEFIFKEKLKSKFKIIISITITSLFFYVIKDLNSGYSKYDYVDYMIDRIP